jgi:hypothetical protein
MTERIEHIPFERIDNDLWDQWIDASVNRRVCATSRFLDRFSPRWEALVMDRGRAVMPVTRGRKYGINYVFQPLFIQQLGLFYPDNSYAGYLPLFIEKLTSIYSFIDISLNEMNGYDNPRFQVTGMNNYLLRLDRPWNSIAAGFSTNTRRNIIKAERLGITLHRGYPPPEVIRMFIMNNAKKYGSIRKHNYARLQSTLEEGQDDGSVSVIAARAHTGEIIAASCFLKDFDRYVYFFSANTEEGRKQGAMFMLISSFLEEHSGSDMLFDFNGSMNPGLARFYKGFGAMQTTYRRLKVNNLMFPVNYFK